MALNGTIVIIITKSNLIRMKMMTIIIFIMILHIILCLVLWKYESFYYVHILAEFGVHFIHFKSFSVCLWKGTHAHTHTEQQHIATS